MKNVLLLTYFFPPQPEAGALRPAYLAKYLPLHNWLPTVITPKFRPPEAHRPATKNPSRLARFQSLRNIRTALRNTLIFPDIAVYWLRPAFREAQTALAEKTYDAVLSTALPGSMHILGAMLQRKYGLPWIADYRDLWTSNPYRRFGPVRTRIERAVERRVIASSNAVTVVGDDMVAAIRTIKPRGDIFVIPNAFDPQDWAGVPNLMPEEFRFCYGGRLYEGVRTPELIFRAVAELRAEGDQAGLAVRFDFFGPDELMVSSLASRFRLADIVRVHGSVERPRMLLAERSAAVLMLLARSDASGLNEQGSKIFEYFGARRPVLATGAKGSVLEKLLRDTGVGTLVTTLDECKSAIRELYQRYQLGSFEVEPTCKIAEFSATTLAARFAEVLDKVCKSSAVDGTLQES